MIKKIFNKERINKMLIASTILLVIFLAFAGQVLFYKSTNELGSFLGILNLITIDQINTLWIGIGCYITAIIIFICSIIYKKFIILDNKIPLFKEITEKNPSNKRWGITFIILSILFLAIIFVLLVLYNFYSHYLLLLWAGSIISGGLSIYFLDKSKPDFSFFKIDLKEAFFLICLLIITLSLTLPYIDLIPRMIEVDEGNMGLFARTFNESTMNLMGYSGFYGIPNLSFFQIYLFSLPFGLDIIGIRYSAVILSSITLIIFYFAVRLMFNKNTAAVSSIVLATSHVFIAYTRTAYHHFQGVFLLSLFLLVFMLALKQGNKLLMYLSGVVLGFGFYLYYSPRVIAPIITLYLLSLLVINFKNRKTLFKWVVSGLFGFIIVLSPLLFATLEYPENFNARVNDVYIFKGEGYRHTSCVYNNTNKVNLWVNSFKNAVSGMFFMKCGGNTYSNTRPFLDMYSIIFFVFGFIIFCFMFKDYRYLFVLISFATIFIIGGSMTVDALCSQRVVIMLPVIAIIIGVSLLNFSGNIENIFSKNVLKQISKRFFIFLSIVIIIVLNFEFYFINKIINQQDESIYDCNTSAAYLVKNNLDKLDFYIVSSNYSLPINTFYGLVDLKQPPARFLLDEKEVYTEIELKKDKIAIAKPVKKNIAFIISGQNLYVNLNILLKQYPGGKIIRQNGGNGSDVKYFIYVVSKEIINSKIKE